MISKGCLQSYHLSSKIEFSDEFFIQQAAKIVRNAVVFFQKRNASDLPRTPTMESLQYESQDHL